MFLRVYTSLRGLTEQEESYRYEQYRQIWADLQQIPGSTTGVGSSNSPGYILVSITVPDTNVSYNAPEGWATDFKEDNGDPDYKIPLF